MMTEHTKFLVDLVKTASQIITDDFIVKSKDDNGDLITNFDGEVEDFIIAKIRAQYPEFDIIGEESNSDGKLTENCFVIDPIDGTINFANKLPLWVIQVAMIQNGETVAAVIYAPKLGEMYYADSFGAYQNGKKMKVNNLDPSKSIYFATHDIAYKLNRNPLYARHMVCAGLAFAWTAAGNIGAAVCGLKTPWDFVPGMYLVKQAGGTSQVHNGVNIATNSNEMMAEILKNL
ncbi:MAG: inositol monophosphatase [Firmicutes bacterium]|nr:inositol monophosphatase [Bacillota bacterium]